MTNLKNTTQVGVSIRNAIAVVDPILRQFTYPLFAADEKGQPDLYASSVLLDIDGRPVLVTAAHAVYEIGRAGSPVHVGTTSGIYTLPPFTQSSPNGQDPLDVAAVRPPDDLLQHLAAPFPISRTGGSSTPHMRCIHGFPLKYNTQRNSLNASQKKFLSYAFTYAGSSHGIGKLYSKHSKDPRIHTALRYVKKSRDHKGNLVQPPQPRGMSGGGFWQIPNIRNPNQFLLEGISIEFHSSSRLVFATKIDEAISFVRKNVP